MRLSASYAGVALASAMGIAFGGCSSDIFDVEVELAPEVFLADFGAANGTIPSVVCDPQSPATCGTDEVIDLQNGAGQAKVSLGCDAATTRCFAQADARANYPVDVLQDDGFTSKVGRRTVSLVRMLDVAITIPVNTTTFDVPQIDVFVGPSGAREPTDAGVVPVGSVRSIPAGATIAAADARHLTLADGTPARDLVETSIKSKSPFAFVLRLTPRIESGAPLPAGMLEAHLQPLLGLGLR